ncbi:hypothetical protein V8C43DRAFT_272385 [Trichoderma afarasin]
MCQIGRLVLLGQFLMGLNYVRILRASWNEHPMRRANSQYFAHHVMIESTVLLEMFLFLHKRTVY